MSQRDRRLVVFPCCGLCNRLQVLACATLLAADSGRRLLVNWHPRPDCGAVFQDLFSHTLPACADLPEDAVVYSSVRRHPGVAEDRYRALLGGPVRQRFGSLPREEAPTVAIFSCHQFLGYFHDPRFAVVVRDLVARVRGDILAAVESFAARHFGPLTVGVHIRRGDWRSQRGLDFYFDAMRRAGNATLFVSTDEPEVFAAVRREFPHAVGYPTRQYDRAAPGAIRDALVELLLLSRTAYLVGTPGSSFSALAQVIGGIPGNSDYGLSISRRDFDLGNLRHPARLLWGRVRRRLRSRAGDLPGA